MPSATIIGVDLGGTKSAIVRYEKNGWKIEEKKTFATHASRGFDAALEEVLTTIEALKTSETVAIGIGLAGLIRQPEGQLLRAPNIPGSEKKALKSALQKKFGMPVAVANDAQCFALAEATVGAGKKHRIVIGLTLGTGVGGGIVIDGKLFLGENGFAGEIGHMLLMPGQPPYTTKDKRGEVEQFISGSALKNRCIDAKHPEDYLEGEVCAFLRPDIFREVAWLCASLTHAFDPSVIVFGGSTGRALGPHMDEILSELRTWILPGTPLPTLAISDRGDAATLGAALLAMKQIENGKL